MPRACGSFQAFLLGKVPVWWVLAVFQVWRGVGSEGRERGHKQRQESGDRQEAKEERKVNVSSGAGARSRGRSERRLEDVRLGLGQWLDSPCTCRLRSCGWSGLLRA